MFSLLPNCSLTEYICINAFDYYAITVYVSVLNPGTLCLAWYSPSYVRLSGKSGRILTFTIASCTANCDWNKYFAIVLTYRDAQDDGAYSKAC